MSQTLCLISTVTFLNTVKLLQPIKQIASNKQSWTLITSIYTKCVMLITAPVASHYYVALLY